MRAAGKRLLFHQAHCVPTAHGRGRGIAGGGLAKGAQDTFGVLLITPDRLVDQYVSAGAIVGFLRAANFRGVGGVVVPARFVLAAQPGVVVVDRFQGQDGAGGAAGGHGERFGGATVVLRVDLEHSGLQGQRRAHGVAQFSAPMRCRVVAPAAAVRHGQRVGAETGVNKTGQQRHPAKVVAHRQKAELGGQRRAEQRALIAEFRQPRVLAAVVFLHRQAVAHQVFRGAMAATVVDGDLHQTCVRGVEQLAQVELGADAHLLRIPRAVLDPAMQVGKRFGVVVAGQLNAFVDQLLAFAAPIAGQR